MVARNRQHRPTATVVVLPFDRGAWPRREGSRSTVWRRIQVPIVPVASAGVFEAVAIG